VSEAGHAHPTLKTYFAIFFTLMFLTALTVWAAFLHLGFWNTPVALGIAIAKATLVVLYFMHVRYAPQRTAIMIGTSLFFLLILFVITISDYLSRGWLPIYTR
jgi:cytochrome c oxidase subunit 4